MTQLSDGPWHAILKKKEEWSLTPYFEKKNQQKVKDEPNSNSDGVEEAAKLKALQQG